METRRSLIVGAAAMAAAASLPRPLRAAPPASTIVRTRAGMVRGTSDDGIHVFRGLRYGEDTRPIRFRAARSPRPWMDVVNATSFAPSCPQSHGRAAPTSEDCLFLNIWTPSVDARAKRPVMLYIHGGAYSSGTVVTPLNDGRHLARHDMVVVTVNHRLNAFGYLYLATLDPRFVDSGNVGQLDLVLALQWVRDNIAAFGGDPNCVMLFGQSGGGAKIATLMGTPAAKGLFHRAITMSGQQVTASGPLNATKRSMAYLRALGVAPDRLGSLFDMPTGKLTEALEAHDPVLDSGGLYFGPVLDQHVLMRHPFYPDANPQGLSIPMMLGNTHDETRAFIPETSKDVQDLTWDNLPDRLGPDLKVDILPSWVVAHYRKWFPHYSPTQVFFAATTAGRSWRGQVIEAEERAKAGAPGFVYQVDFRNPTRPERGAPHMTDIPLAFGTIDAPGASTGDNPQARAASDQLMAAYIAFTRTGDPNRAGMPRWPKYDLRNRATMIVDSVFHVENDPRGRERELFAAVPYIQPGT